MPNGCGSDATAARCRPGAAVTPLQPVADIDWADKRVLVAGAGVTGRSVSRVMRDRAASVEVVDVAASDPQRHGQLLDGLTEGIALRPPAHYDSGALASARTERDPVFGFDVVADCPNVPRDILLPRNAWADASAYDATARRLAELFRENFTTYQAGVGADIKAAGPDERSASIAG